MKAIKNALLVMKTNNFAAHVLKNSASLGSLGILILGVIYFTCPRSLAGVDEQSPDRWVSQSKSYSYQDLSDSPFDISQPLYSDDFGFAPNPGDFHVTVNSALFDDYGAIGSSGNTEGLQNYEVPTNDISIVGNRLVVNMYAHEDGNDETNEDLNDGYNINITWWAKKKCSCSDGSDSCTASTPDPQDGCVRMSISLGKDQYDQNAGQLMILSEVPTVSLAQPVSLQTYLASTTERINDNTTGAPRQIRTTQLLVDIVSSNEFSYALNFYTTGNFSPTKINGLYVPTGLPYNTLVIQNPDASTNTFNRLRINQSGSLGTHEYDYTWVASAQQWNLTTGGGLRTETRTRNWDSTQTILTETNIILNSDNSVAFKQIETYQSFPWGVTNLIQRTIDPDGALPQIYTWTYDTNSADTNYSRLVQITQPSGYWEKYSYDSSARLIKNIAQFEDAATNAPDSSCLVTSNTYGSPVNSLAITNSQTYTTNIVSLLGHEISRSYRVDFFGGSSNFVCQTAGAAINATDNLVTVTFQYTTGPFQWWTFLIQNPDGTITTYRYSTNSTSKTTTVYSGVPDSTGTNVLDGIKTIGAVDLGGHAISNATYDVASGLLTSSAVSLQTDALGRPTLVEYNDGTTEATQYGCCGIDSQTDREGIVTSYIYDDLKRVTSMTHAGVATLYIYDAAGRVLTTTRQGTDNTQILQNVSTYNPVGWITTSTNALNYGTLYTNALDANGHMIKTTTNPDGGTRIETYFKDNSLMNVVGTSVLGISNIFGVETPPGETNYRAFTQKIKLNTNGVPTSEWTKTYTDLAGRAYKTIYSSSTSSNATSRSFYNNMGLLYKQMDPDGVTTLYQYNAKGQLVYTATDLNTNGLIDTNGTDRITATISDVTNDNGEAVSRTRTFAWSTNNSGISNLISTGETSTDGLRSWNIVFNNGVGATNFSETDYNPSHAYKIVTTTAPDGSSTVTIYQNGRLISATQKDGTGMQIGQTVYGYDPHGRQNTSTDARNGTTTTYYDNADEVVAMLTPSPDGIKSGEATTNYFDSMNRVIRTTLPDNTSVTNVYFTNGLLQTTYGSRTYPVAYTYDYGGRMATMTTWTNFAASAGAAVTTWKYDAFRGFLTNKAYADGNGPSYTYTPGGRLAVRTWERTATVQHKTVNLQSFYGYNNAGEISSVTYTDSLPSLAYGYDRLGRQTSITNGSTVCTLAYDGVGDLISESYSGGPLNGLSVTNAYDNLLRRTALALASQSATLTQFGYDGASRLQAATNGTTSATYNYIVNSPLLSQITFQSNSVTRMTTTKSYDYLNRLTQISSLGSASGASPLSFSYANNSANQRTNVTNSDNSYWVYQYDNLGQVISGRKYWADGTAVSGQQFTNNFDDIGNRKTAAFGGDQIGSNLRSATYTNNSLNQIIGRTIPGYMTVIGSAGSNATVTANLQRASRYGNYFSDELPVTNTSAAIWQPFTNVAVLNNGTNADIITTNQGNGLLTKTPEAFTYDADGNLLSDGQFTYAWDDENRLTNITSQSGIPTPATMNLAFVYDYMGRRIQKIFSSNSVPQYTNKFVYDGWNLIAELGPNNALIRSYTWGNDLSGTLQGSGGVGGLLVMSSYGTVATNGFVAYDGNGNVAGLLNAADGTTLATYEYGPFGEAIRANGPLAKQNPVRFSTKYQDETDLLYFGYRYYNPSIGRWLNRDSIEERGGNNLYAFVSNVPIAGYDGLGLFVGVVSANILPDKRDHFLSHRRALSALITWTAPTTGAWGNSCGCKPCQKVRWTQRISRNGGAWTPDDDVYPGTQTDWDCNPALFGDAAFTSAFFEDHPGRNGPILSLIFSWRVMLISYAECIEGPDKGTVYATVDWGGKYDRATDTITVDKPIYNFDSILGKSPQ